MGDPTWSTIRAAASQKRRADEPRRAAMRAAFKVSRKFKRQPPGEVRDVLVAEMAARGITALTSEQLDLFTAAVGRYILGRLQAADSVIVREILTTNAYTAVELNAVAVDGDPRIIDVGVPDRV